MPGARKYSQLWQQMQADGARTGYRDMFLEAEKRAEQAEKDLKRLQRTGALNPVTYGRFMLELLDGFNTVLENCTRLAAYKVALDTPGVSRAQAAVVARELTVDFNRKGRLTREINPMYAFFNASVQGSERTIRSLKGPEGPAIIAGGLLLGSLQALLLLAAGYDDDEIPEYVKSRNLIIPTGTGEDGKKRYFTMPYPLGMHVIPNTGRVLTELTIAGGRGASTKALEAISEILGGFNPLGGENVLTLHGAARMVMPTNLDPVVDTIANKNFAGAPIERVNPQGEDRDTRPGFQRAREMTLRSTSGQVYLGAAKAINRATGGDDVERGLASPTPEMVRYWAQVVGGGVLREVEKMVDVTTAKAAGEKVNPQRIPVVGSTIREVDPDEVARSRFRLNSNRIEQAEGAIGRAKKAGDADALARLQDKPEAALIAANNRVQRQISALNKQAAATVNDRETMRLLDEQRAELMRNLNESLAQLEGDPAPELAKRIRGSLAGTRP